MLMLMLPLCRHMGYADTIGGPMLGLHSTPVIYMETTTMTTATTTVLTLPTPGAQTTMIAMFDAILDAQQAVRDAAKATREACLTDGDSPAVSACINVARAKRDAAHRACDAVDPRWRPSKATRAAYCIDEGTSAGQLVGAVRLLIPGARKAASAQAKGMMAAHKARC